MNLKQIASLASLPLEQSLRFATFERTDSTTISHSYSGMTTPPPISNYPTDRKTNNDVSKLLTY